MPTKKNNAGELQPYVPAGNGDSSGEYSNKHFTTFARGSGKNKVDNVEKKSYLDGYIQNYWGWEELNDDEKKRVIERFNNQPKSQQYYDGLNYNEQAGLTAMSFDTRNLNEYMSGRRKDFSNAQKERLDKQIANVKSAISKYNLEEPITLYRGVSKEEFDDIKEGGKTTSFKSTSTDEKRAEAFAKNQGGYIIEYHAGKGSRVADVNGVPNANEDEFLIDSDVKYKKITKNGNRIIIEI